MQAEQRPDDALDLLVFELAGVRFGVEMRCVREVVRAVLVTPLPGAPAAVEGVIDVRGEVVAVYDLRLRFGLPPRPLHPAEHLVIAWTGERLAAMRCERAEWIEQIPSSAVERSVPVDLSGGRVEGVARMDDGLVLIHDLRTFLDDAEALALADALAARESREAE
jgi:purine-binding chemotaxis protein CheW